MSKATISKISEAEAALILDMGKRTFRDTYMALNSRENFEKYMAENFTEQKILEELTNPESEFHVAWIGEQPAGYMKVNRGSAQTESSLPNSLEIERIYVLKRYQGYGIGRQFIQKARDIARAKNIGEIWLGVWEKNPSAIRFYEHQGFAAFGTHIFTVGDEDQTDIMMKLAIG